jgi:hypothetical protein
MHAGSGLSAHRSVENQTYPDPWKAENEVTAWPLDILISANRISTGQILPLGLSGNRSDHAQMEKNILF